MTCTITGYLRAPDGSALPDTAVTIHLQKIAGTADGAAMPKEVTATSNGSGLLTLNLLPGIYRMRWQHDGICHYARLGVPDELSAVLGDLIDPAGMVVRGRDGASIVVSLVDNSDWPPPADSDPLHWYVRVPDA